MRGVRYGGEGGGGGVRGIRDGDGVDNTWR